MESEKELLNITMKLKELYPDLNNEAMDFEKVFETITSDIRHYLIYETMDKE